jgi:hypothetical protein
MLSHLIGAANRADIRRLCQLEEENATLPARLDRQQTAIREAVAARDACLQDLRRTLAQQGTAALSVPDEHGVMPYQLVADLERRLASEGQRSAVLHDRLASARAAFSEERLARAKVERENSALRWELEAIERSLPASCEARESPAPSQRRLDGVTLLYIGGRPHHVAHLRTTAEESGARFLHHDGGVEHHLNLLAGLASQADLVVFPVDCISHHAAQAAKQLCRQAGKQFIPLRTASTTSLLAALRRPDVAGLTDAAD